MSEGDVGDTECRMAWEGDSDLEEENVGRLVIKLHYLKMNEAGRWRIFRPKRDDMYSFS